MANCVSSWRLQEADLQQDVPGKFKRTLNLILV